MIWKTSISLSLAATLALTACGTPDQYAGRPHGRMQEGATAGAALGAVAGAAANKNNRLLGAATGAILGAAVGGTIGSALDQQAAELQASLAGSGITVTNMGSYLIVNTPSDLLFATDSATVSASLYDDLQAVASNLQQYPNSTIQVIGHTDNTGSAAYNMDLSQRRAGAVAAILINDGVTASRVQVIGRGEDQPIASNLTEEGKAQNRRVEIIIRPN